LGKAETEIFLQMGLDSNSLICPSGKIGCPPKPGVIVLLPTSSL
jgi:hypothetical protein